MTKTNTEAVEAVWQALARHGYLISDDAREAVAAALSPTAKTEPSAAGSLSAEEGETVDFDPNGAGFLHSPRPSAAGLEAATILLPPASDVPQEYLEGWCEGQAYLIENHRGDGDKAIKTAEDYLSALSAPTRERESDLVKRLRDEEAVERSCESEHRADLHKEAADHIAALEARNARLEEQLRTECAPLIGATGEGVTGRSSTPIGRYDSNPDCSISTITDRLPLPADIRPGRIAKQIGTVAFMQPDGKGGADRIVVPPETVTQIVGHALRTLTMEQTNG